jgi:hypothetical protein
MRFSNLIQPNLESFNYNELIYLIERINSNDQIYARANSEKQNQIIRDKMKKINPDFNFDKYSFF